MRVTIAVAAVGLLSLLTACQEESGTATGAPTGSQPPATESTGGSASAAPPAQGQCPVGDWEVATISGKSGAQVNGVPVVAKSGGGFTLSLTADNAWTLTGENAPVTLEAAGLSVEATIDGTAKGDYAKTGSNYTFRQQSATGRVTLTKPVAGVSSFSMDEVGPALAPRGQATLTCGAGTLQISSESVVLDLTSAGGAPVPAPTTGGSTGGAPGGGGSTTLSESGQNRTIDCAGKSFAINGSANRLTFTGSCAAVSVNGTRNELTIEKVGEISVNGSFNKVTWSSGDPKTSNTGQGNTISQG